MRLLWVILLASCQGNLFAPLETTNVAEDATLALEVKDSSKATRLLLKTLGSEISALFEALELAPLGSPEAISLQLSLQNMAQSRAQQHANTGKYLSILASAQAQAVGIDPLDLALAMIDNQNQASVALTSQPSFEILFSLWPYLPAATDSAQRSLRSCLSALAAIPSAELTEADQFKQALFFTATSSLTLKALDQDGDGTLSPLEILSMTTNDATSIIAVLSTAATAFASQALGSNSASLSDAITELYNAIAPAEGEDPVEKLTNILATQNAPEDFLEDPL